MTVGATTGNLQCRLGGGLIPVRSNAAPPQGMGPALNQPLHWLGQVRGKCLLDPTLASPLVQLKPSTGRGHRVGVGETASPRDLVLLVENKGQLSGSCGQTGMGSKSCWTTYCLDHPR